MANNGRKQCIEEGCTSPRERVITLYGAVAAVCEEHAIERLRHPHAVDNTAFFKGKRESPKPGPTRRELESANHGPVRTDGGGLDGEEVEAETLKPHPYELQRAVTGDHVVVFGDEDVQFEVSGEADTEDLDLDWSTIDLEASDVRSILAGESYEEEREDVDGRPFTLVVTGGDRDPKGRPVHTESGR